MTTITNTPKGTLVTLQDPTARVWIRSDVAAWADVPADSEAYLVEMAREELRLADMGADPRLRLPSGSVRIYR